MKERDIFRGKQEPLPYEYPQAIEFANAIRFSLWLAEEFRDEIKRDVLDYKHFLTDVERKMLTRAILAISQIEVKVKRFWGKIYEMFPYTEFEILGATHGFSESTHFECYSMIISELGLEEEFEKLQDVPCIQGRVDYLTKYLDFNKDDKKSYVTALLLFSEFIEACSLYSQFYIGRSVCNATQKMKAIDNIIMTTSIEEDCHFQTGAWLVNTILEENPEWRDEEMEKTIRDAAKKSFRYEKDIIDWIFEGGEPDYLSKDEVINFLKSRYNKGLEAVGYSVQFDVDEQNSERSSWFEYETILEARQDFFDRHSRAYQFGNRDFSINNLFPKTNDETEV